MVSRTGNVHKGAQNCCPPNAISGTGVDRFLPPELGELATLTAKLAIEREFRTDFHKDPAMALSRAGISVQPHTVEMLLKSHTSLIDTLTREAGDIVSRSRAFTWEGERLAIVPLVAAFLAGLLVAETLHHHSPAMMAAGADPDSGQKA